MRSGSFGFGRGSHRAARAPDLSLPRTRSSCTMPA
jgi:hypothetical protein